MVIEYYKPGEAKTAGTGLMGVRVAAGTWCGVLNDLVFDDKFMKHSLSRLKPGQAALFTMMQSNASDSVIERPGEKGGRVLRTNLDNGAKNHLRRAFQQALTKAITSHRRKNK